MNCNTTHYRANSSSVPGDPTDPALKHFARALRAGDPVFARESEARSWRRARRIAVGAVLTAVSTSAYWKHLVLRGSLLMQHWFSDAAREPKDIDWVVIPQTLKLDSAWANAFFSGITSHIASHASPGFGVRIDGAGVQSDDIWTYERAPGRRLVFPWYADGLPPGSVQMDFVFEEPMPEPPAVSDLTLADESVVTLQTASPELSLAWKLLWLHTDMLPQGKDLYDAVLLAEQVTLPAGLLAEVFKAASTDLPDVPFHRLPYRWRVDWENFLKESPWIEGNVEQWQARLAQALKSSLEQK